MGDTDHNGFISETEFKNHLQPGSKLRHYLGALGLNRKDAELFFWMLKGANVNEDSVDIRAFVAGLVKLKGGATSLDMQALIFHTQAINRKLDDLSASMSPMDRPLGSTSLPSRPISS